MTYSDNSINILTIKTYKGIGRAWIVKNLRDNEKVDAIVSLLNKDAKEDYQITVEKFERNKARIIDNIEKLEGFVDGVVAIGDTDFPPYRGKVKNSEQPIFLFYRGDLSLLKTTSKNIAVIGLLNPDKDIEIMEQEVVAELVKNGATIISGLALGCDTIAHRQALNSNGKTVAILPSPLNNILPVTNKELANEIVNKGGLLITEYYEDTKSKMELGGRYQERDRLQALFSDNIVLTASYAKNDQGNDSGSRLAMGYALNYSIPRAVIYDPELNANNPKYDLSRQLIREQRDITIINQKNLSETVKKIISNKPLMKNNQQIQSNLFN
ncbi:MAG: DNA-binding protein [Candidatus Tagabacteria bacterium CG10_big_fil_rev_8_21_14_0_10_40_13]|uniref:DNA-binding protein n=1 Tax=Candidatus Tagabacteria bacterium CG10_big_fil_rev_8_21_14_0_10_40_13 TaxID=1975022 RepID=A0A2M8L8D6_9BACT|nr:MAG: DNA-binding protein [Candidatus Tagabacteria bacterium CG10_big_fil_rev_8_21_14_0_10_40_13]